LERYGCFQVLTFPKCCGELFEGKWNDLVVQVCSVSMVKNEKLEGDLSVKIQRNIVVIGDVLVG